MCWEKPDPLEFLRPDHGDEQVDQEQKGNDSHDEGCHKFETFLQSLAPGGVRDADDEKEQRRADIDQVGVSRGQDASASQETDQAQNNSSLFHDYP
jgi:hypothetical protein